MDASSKETSTSPEIKYRRVLLKISGEALMGQEAYGIDSAVVSRIADEIVSVHKMGVQIALVVGGGNIFRGISGGAAGIDRTTADYMGMLATVINALSFQSALENCGVTTRVLSAIPMATVCEPYIRRRAVRHIEKGRIVIFAAGTGNPFFSTDTTAALRASEMGCEVILKATKVDGVYSADPVKEPDAVRYDRLSYFDVLSRNLKFMDTTAISLARENNISIVIFSITAPGTFADVMRGGGVHTVISEEE